MRLPIIPPAEISAEQRAVYEDMKAGIAAKYSSFVTIRNDGAILGPWSAWLHEPELGAAIWNRFRAAYEIYAHSTVARTTGITEDQLAAIEAGRKPAGLSDEAETAYDAATALLEGGVLADSIYDKALGSFGQHGVNELIYLVGHYCFVSITLNAFDIPVPKAG